MAKVLYVLAALAFGIGMLDISGAVPGSRREVEAGILFLLTPVLLVAGFAASRMSTKKCPKCAERVKKEATACKHCGADMSHV
jgi:hypothetical protein